MKFAGSQAGLFNCSFPVWFPSEARKSSATIREAENRKGMPKLDSAVIAAPLELTKDGGGEQVLHRMRDCFTASIISGSGLELSLLRTSEVPSSQVTWMAVAFSDFFTQRVVSTLAFACAVSVAARPVWQTPPRSVVDVPGRGSAGLSALYLYWKGFNLSNT
jgi:hypothetical protein